MSRIKNLIRKTAIQAAAVLSVAIPVAAQENSTSPAWKESLLDDCKMADNISSIGTAWTANLDHDRGGSSTLGWDGAPGTLAVSGTIRPIPGFRGPGTAGMVLPFSAGNEKYDVNQWSGIEITIRRSGASLLLRLHSSEIKNGDYFAVNIPQSSEFETYRFPFEQMGQVMSPQQPWSGAGATGIELVAWSFGNQDFEWEIDRVAFYK